MNRDTYGVPVSVLVDITGCSSDTARRWKRKGSMPYMAARLVALLYDGDLGALSDSWAGFRLNNDRLWTPSGWDIRPGEVMCIPLRRQYAAALERQVRELSDRVESCARQSEDEDVTVASIVTV